MSGTRFHAAAIGGGSGLNRGGYSLAPCAFTPASSATDSEAVHAEEDLRFARLIFFLFCLAKEWNVIVSRGEGTGCARRAFLG